MYGFSQERLRKLQARKMDKGLKQVRAAYTRSSDQSDVGTEHILAARTNRMWGGSIYSRLGPIG
eukprot:1169192-Prorocentrum_minimum.AAC.2